MVDEYHIRRINKVNAKKYKIKLTKNGKRKHMSELSKGIHEYESKHNIVDGLYAY